MDLVLHDIPADVDRALRQRAEAIGTTVDAVAADVLARGLNVTPPGPPYHDLDWFFGSDPLEQSVLDALAECDVVHPDDWK